MRRKLNIEALDDRCLPTAGLSPLSSLAQPEAPAPAATTAAQIGAATSDGSLLSLAGGTDAAATLPRGGIHQNHNETMLRDAGRPARRKAARRRAR